MNSFQDASGYERLMGRWSTRLARELIRFAALPDTARVLDVGCGTGSFASALLASTPRATVVGIDPSATFIGLARKRFQDPRARFETGNALKLGFADGA